MEMQQGYYMLMWFAGVELAYSTLPNTLVHVEHI